MRVDFGGDASPSLDIPASARCRIAVTTRYGDKSADLALLTEGQRDCLRLVYQHMTSKDIARVLNVSPHTVDMRLRTAMKTLGVASRIEAARLLWVEENGADAPSAGYQTLIYQPPELVPEPDQAIVAAPASDGDSETDPSLRQPSSEVGPPASRPPGLAGASIATSEHPAGGLGAFATDPGFDPPATPLAGSLQGAVVAAPGSALAGKLPWGARNDLSVGLRLAWIFIIAVGSALGFGAVLAALAALKALI